MKCSYGELIGNSIEKVLDVDVDTDNMGWGSFLRVKVEMNLTKPLERSHKITVMGGNMWIPDHYEKLCTKRQVAMCIVNEGEVL